MTPAMASPNHDLPGISILLAVRNEAEHLDRCLQSLVALDYPTGSIEILLADGMSTDGTPEIIDRWAKTNPEIRRIQNPGLIVSTGMNLALAQCRYDLVLWTSGHTLLKPDHLRRCLSTMLRMGVAAVGGVLETAAFSPIGRINAAILSSAFGVGDARHRIGGESGWVPAVTMALYRKEAILAAGGFNESLTTQSGQRSARPHESDRSTLLSRCRHQANISLPRNLWWPTATGLEQRLLEYYADPR